MPIPYLTIAKYALPALATVGLVIWGISAWNGRYNDGYSDGKKKGKDEIQALWDADKSQRQKELDALKAERDAAQANLNAQTGSIQQDLTNEVAGINADFVSDLGGLRDRPTARAADPVPANGDGAAPREGCTGAGLARDDAGFLVWFGSQARRLQAERDACYASYDTVKGQIDELNRRTSEIYREKLAR